MQQGTFFGMGHFGDAVSATPIRRRRFGDGRFGDKSLIRHDTFDGSAFYAPCQTFLSSALGLEFSFMTNKHPL